MQHPSPTATMPLLHGQAIQCAQCADPARMTASLGVCLAVPVIRLVCLDHETICQFPIAATAFAHHSPGNAGPP